MAGLRRPDSGHNPGDDLAEYQVHRSVFQAFTPTASTLVSPVPAGTTSFSDTTNIPTPADSTDPFGNAFYYMLAAKTQDGRVVAGPVQLVRLPKAGYTIKIINASGATTLSKAQPTTNEQQLAGQPWLSVGNNSSTYGVTRTVVNYPTMASAGVPAGATVTDAELKLWGWFNANTGGGSATYEAHALTQNFDAATATWNNASSTTAWTTPGGGYSATVAGTVSGLSSDPNRQEWPVTSVVQGWVGTPSSEHGLLVRLSGETTSGPQERELFLNRSAQEPNLRPELVVIYLDTVPEDPYYVPGMPDRLAAASSYTVPVTVTNTTGTTLGSADWAPSYHWTLPDGTDVTSSANQAQTALPADIAPGGTATIPAAVKTPDNSGSGSTRTAYDLGWDLYDKTTGTWLSGATPGVPTVAPLTQPAHVEQPGSDLIGLERFYQYTGVGTGSGSALLNNADTGNVVWSYNALSNPSRGFATFVRMAYNSMDTSNSAMGFGWSLQTSTLMRLGTALDFHPNPNPTRVTLTDGDGTGHWFTWDATTGQWLSPPGVHEYLQQVGSCDPSGKTANLRAWLLTRPDRTQFYFDCQGYQSAVVDRNGNEADFTYSQRKSWNKPVKFLAYITDPAGRQTLALSYYAKGDNYNYIDGNGNVASGTNLTDPQIIDQVKSITDISGRTITLLYTVQGLMAQMTDGDGSPLAKTFKFGYDMTQGNKNVKLVSVTDPRAHATSLAYYTAPVDPKFKWSLQTITDRRGGTVGFGYTQPGGGQIQTTVTDQNSHSSTYLMDPTGRPVQATNAKGQVTRVAWDGDNNVNSLTENNGAVTTWTHDQNTGYLLSTKDAEANKNGTASTTYTYQTGLNGHIADLISKLTPQQRLWTFGYDTNGDLTTVTDPDGNATSTAGDYTTTYAYDSVGQLTTATDADGNPTTYSNYDPNGYPQTITDALAKATTFGYDVRGNVTQITDPLQHATTQAYDVFGRPGQHVAPKDQAAGVYITTPAPVYDGDDNTTQTAAANGAVTTYSYDNNDEKTAGFAPPDTSTSPQRKTTYSYDPVGNVISRTEPDGNVGGGSGSFTTTFAYDAIDELTSQTNAANATTGYAYDDVGNPTIVTDPLTHVTKYSYDLDHRLRVTTDPANHTTSKSYDLDGLVSSTTDQNGSTTLLTLDPRGDLTQKMVPHDTSGNSIVYDTTQYAYDQVGNRTRVVTPRGVAAGVTNACTQNCAFTWVTQFDPVNRVSARLSGYDPADPVYNTPAETDYSYDPAGRVASVSAPPSNGQSLRNVTSYAYFDNGWGKTSTDPWDITTNYDYNNLGEQTARTITSAGGSSSRAMTWGFYPDGKLSTRADDGVPTGLAVELVDNSDFQNTSATGTWTPSNAGSNYQGYNYQTHAAGSGTDAFGWTLDIPQDGNYTVYVKYPAVSSAATAASYKVGFSGGTATVAVNQTTGAGTWVSLGKWAFTQNGTGQKVTLTQNAGGTVVADAVKAVRDNSADTNTAHHHFAYSYDPNGNLTSITDSSPDATITDYVVTYDGIDQVTDVQEQASGTTKHASTFGYDAAGDVLTQGHDAATSTFTYDTRGLLARVTNAESATDPSPKVTSYTYTPAGQVATEVKGNSNTVTDTYFADGLPLTQTEDKPDGTVVAGHTYGYDPNGNKTRDVEKLMNADDNAAYLAHTLAYSYDPRDRIAQVTKDGTVTERYAHDANDNVTSQTVNNIATTFNFDRNRLLTAVTAGVTSAYNYDPFGRLDTISTAGNPTAAYSYDGFDKITSVRQYAGASFATTSYTYDPLARTTSQTTNAGTGSAKTTSYDYLALSSELVDERSGGSVTKTYQYALSGERLSQTRHNSDGTTTNGYYSYNDHSDVEAVTGQTGGTTATYGYTAYGQDDTTQFSGADKPGAQPAGSPPYNAYRFNADRFDGPGGYDMGFRDYSPGLNQFLTRDMYNGALDDQQLADDPFTGSRYTFGGGNPISNIELDGHCIASWLQSACNVFNGAVDVTVNDFIEPVRGIVSNTLLAGAGMACPSMGGPTGAEGCIQAAQQDIPAQVEQKTQIHVPLGGDPNSRGYRIGEFLGRWVLPAILGIAAAARAYLARAAAAAAARAAAEAEARAAAEAAARAEARQAAAAAGDRIASSAAGAARLRAQLAAEEISGGHAFVKHVVEQGEFPGVRTRAEFAQVIEDVIINGEPRGLSGGRTAYWRGGVVVIRNPGVVDGGTAFVPRDGYAYFLGLH